MRKPKINVKLFLCKRFGRLPILRAYRIPLNKHGQLVNTGGTNVITQGTTKNDPLPKGFCLVRPRDVTL